MYKYVKLYTYHQYSAPDSSLATVYREQTWSDNGLSLPNSINGCKGCSKRHAPGACAVNKSFKQ